MKQRVEFKNKIKYVQEKHDKDIDKIKEDIEKLQKNVTCLDAKTNFLIKQRTKTEGKEDSGKHDANSEIDTELFTFLNNHINNCSDNNTNNINTNNNNNTNNNDKNIEEKFRMYRYDDKNRKLEIIKIVEKIEENNAIDSK
jgi:hypothetical protein